MAQRVIMSLQQGGNSNIFAMDLRSQATTRLTDTAAIDTAPSYSPDGARICFESDRGGRPQIYVMAAHGGVGAAHQLRRRLLFDAGLVAARRLHRLHQAGPGPLRDRHHEAGRLRRAHPDRGLPQRRPDLGAERPRDHVLPRSGRQCRAALYTVDVTGRNEQRVPTPSYASDPAWSPLLTLTRLRGRDRL